MPNITLSVDETTYRAARVEAAKRDTTARAMKPSRFLIHFCRPGGQSTKNAL